MRAISTTLLDDGMVVDSLKAEFALRTRVSMSAIGSVIVIFAILLWSSTDRPAVRGGP
jgi:hypothetical protein